ncbi:hypothetical protein PIB30_089869 [Stylosanthes scabra]|uniref:Uncharacterized protein n=1 Tax=Stylosanthes scabra TaxID=79078 RepID=A0ABU6XWN0_9FABA|nr:hypothetical protein [Stylosanthes scabra]
MIAPANVCAHNHHKRASEGNGAAAERPRGAHLLAMEPRPSGCPTRRSRDSGTRVGGRKDGWSGPFTIVKVSPYGHAEIQNDKDGTKFVVENGALKVKINVAVKNRQHINKEYPMVHSKKIEETTNHSTLKKPRLHN